MTVAALALSAPLIAEGTFALLSHTTERPLCLHGFKCSALRARARPSEPVLSPPRPCSALRACAQPSEPVLSPACSALGARAQPATPSAARSAGRSGDPNTTRLRVAT
jgi:hypothetical protein